METWLQKAHARVITNTVAALRSLKQNHEEGCLEDALRRYMLSATPDEVEALQSADDQQPILKLLAKEDKERLERLYPLASLSEDVALPLNLEVVWRRTLGEEIASQSSRGHSAYFRSRVSLNAISMVHPFLYSSRTGGDAAQQHPSAPVVASTAGDDGENPSDMQRKRPRLDDEDQDDSTNGRSVDHPGMQWLRELPNGACVEFAKNCVAQSQRLARERRKRSDDRGEEGMTDGNASPVSASTKLLLESIRVSERRLRAQPTPAVQSMRSVPVRTAQAQRPHHGAHHGVADLTSFPPESSFEWSSECVGEDGDGIAHCIQAEYLFPADEDLRGLPIGGVLYATFDARSNFSWRTIREDAAARIRLPNNLRAATIHLVSRGEAAAASAKFK